MRALILFVPVLFSLSAIAQPVNAEILRKDRLDEGWSAELNASLALASGNVQLLDLGAGALVQYMHLSDKEPHEGAPPFVAHRVFLRVSARQAERAGDRFINNAFAHGRWTAMWFTKIGTELFSQLQFNEFLKLNTRVLNGAGVRLDVIHERDLALAFGSAYMLELEVLDVVDDDAPFVAHRWSNYANLRAHFVDDALLSQVTVYVQPRFDAPEDLRLLGDLEFAVSVTEHLAFSTSLLLLYDSRPPPGVETTDVRLSSNIKLQF